MDSVGTAVEKVAVLAAKEPNTPQVITVDNSEENKKLQAQMNEMKAEMEKMRLELKAKPTVINAPASPANNVANPPQNQPITINVPPSPNQDAALQRLEGKLDVIGNRLKELEGRPVSNGNNNAPVVIVPTPNPIVNTEIRTQFAGVRKVSVYFGNNITEIQKQDYETLNAIVTDLQNNPNMNVSIRGYASKNGKATVNRKLSEQRANNVRNYLISKGIDRSRILLDSFGDSVSVYGNEFDRRVEVELLNN